MHENETVTFGLRSQTIFFPDIICLVRTLNEPSVDIIYLFENLIS